MEKRVWEQVKGLWAAWARLAHRIGDFQARVLLTFLYAVILLPFAICVRLFADPLRTNQRPAKWLDAPQEALDMPWAHKQ
jgi:hypothetical protein